MKGDRQRLELARDRAARGFYDRRETIEATAEAVVRSRALHMLLDNYVMIAGNGMSEMDETKEEKISEIKRRIDEGFYDDPNCLAALAEKIIRKMGLEPDE